jgi:hypothetical protein
MRPTVELEVQAELHQERREYETDHPVEALHGYGTRPA